MMIKGLLTAAYASAYFVSTAIAEQVTPSVDALTDGIRTFICDFEDSGSTPIILVQKEEQWYVAGNEIIYDIVEIGNGFRFEKPESESFLGILQERSDGWIFNILSEYQISSNYCQGMDEFSQRLVFAIAPKIYRNADVLEYDLKNSKEEIRLGKAIMDELNSEIFTLEEKNKKFEENVKSLEDEALMLRLRHANLLESVANGDAVKAYEFISEALSVKEATKRITFVQEGGLGDAAGLNKFCVDLLMNQPTKFGDSCRRRLIMYMIEDGERKRDLSASMSSDDSRDPPMAGKHAVSSAPNGPPLNGGEQDALRVAVSSCWNVGSLSSDALATTVVVGVSLQETGVPDSGSIRLVSFSGGSESGARQAFEAARRAIIRCGARGFPLPVEKYSQWREIKMVFDPEGLRLR